jgi:hypothetical protein
LPVWEIGLSDLIQQVFGSADALLNQWFLIRAELKTSINYFETDIYRCSGKEFYSYTNPVWLKINSPNLTPESLVINDLNIFPNPARDKLNIKSEITGTIIIYSITGEILLTENIENSKQIDISILQNGTYFISFSGKGCNQFVKLVVIN